MATWVDDSSKARSKAFSIAKLGDDAAFSMAVEYRNKVLKELEDKGVFYSETHGVPRNN